VVVEHVVCGPEELLIFMMFGHELLTGSFVESAGFDVFSLMEVGTHGLVEQVLIPVVLKVYTYMSVSQSIGKRI